MNDQEIEEQGRSERDERIELAQAVWGLQNDEFYRSQPGEIRKVIQEASRAVEMGQFEKSLETLDLLDHPPDSVDVVYEQIHKMLKARKLVDREIPKVFLPKAIEDIAGKIRTLFEKRDDLAEEDMRKLSFNVDDLSRRLQSPSETNRRVVEDKMREILAFFAESEIQSDDDMREITGLARMIKVELSEDLRQGTEGAQKMVDDNPQLINEKEQTKELYTGLYKIIDIPPSPIILGKINKGTMTVEKLRELNAGLQETLNKPDLTDQEAAARIGELEAGTDDDYAEEMDRIKTITDLRQQRSKLSDIKENFAKSTIGKAA